MKKHKTEIKKQLIGWREWCVLPELQIPAIKVKADTGATTSALHAVHIRPFTRRGKDFVKFETHPVQKDWHTSIICEAPLIDQLHVTSSAGHREKRYAISTPIVFGGERWNIKLTLTSRETMGFRMLLGREAMKGRLIVDPQRSYLFGNKAGPEIKKLYKIKKILRKL